MDNKLKTIIRITLCVALSVLLVLGLAFGIKSCKEKGGNGGTSSTTAQTNNTSEKSENDKEYVDGFEDWNDGFVDSWDEESANIEDTSEQENSNSFLSDSTYYEPLIINNDQPYLNQNFLGFNGIYMLFTYMRHPSYGYAYTDEQATLELDRIKDMGVKIVRTTYSSGMVYNRTDGVWHWEDSPYLNAFIKTAKELKNRDIDVAFTFTWYLGNFTETTFDYAFSDGYFPASISSTGWGSTYTGTADQTDEEIEAIRIKQSVSGYKKFVKDSILKFRAEGLTNFEYIFGFTECNNAYMDGNVRNYDKVCKVFDIGITATHEALKEMNLRSEYTIVGPCDNWGGDFDEDDEEKYSRLVQYTLENLTEEVDIIGSHNGYDRGSDFYEDDFYARTDRKVGNAMRSANAAGKEFWIDEYNVATDIEYARSEKRLIYDNPMSGVAFGAMANGVMNMGGVSNLFIWMLVEQQWPNDQDGGEFDKGVQIGSGYMPNLYESSVPKAGWYSYAMIQKYVGQGKLVMCNDGAKLENQSGYYYSCIERDDGEITVLVTNYQSSSFPIEVVFQKQLGGKTFYRHVYSVGSVNPTVDAIIPEVSAIAENVNIGIKDTLEPYSVTVYTTYNK